MGDLLAQGPRERDGIGPIDVAFYSRKRRHQSRCAAPSRRPHKTLSPLLTFWMRWETRPRARIVFPSAIPFMARYFFPFELELAIATAINLTQVAQLEAFQDPLPPSLW